MATPLFSMNRGPSGNLATQVFHDGYVYYTTDTHRLYIDCSITSEDGAAPVLGTNRFQIEVENAANAANAAKAAALTAGKGSISKPVYIDSSGLPQECTSIALKANTAGTADQARKLVNSSNSAYAVGTDGKTIVYFNGGIPTASTQTVGDVNTPVYLNKGVLTVCTSVDATSSGALKLVEIVEGVEQDQAKGSPSIPVYFSDGVPKACTSISLKADTAGAADTATLANSAKKLVKSDGTTAYSAGDANTPVYFTTGGVPSACTGLDLDTTGSAAKLSAADKGSSTKPIYFSSGVPAECGAKLDVAISGKADTAGSADSAAIAAKAKMLVKSDGSTAYNAGDANTPVYFTTSGVPAPCTSLDLNTTGSAAKLSAADKGSATKPIYFSSGIPAECNMKFDLASGSTVAISDNLAANNSSTRIPNTQWVQSAIDNKMAAANAMTFKGTIALAGTAGTTADVIGIPKTQNAGDTYMINVAGNYAGQAAEAGDLLIAIKDRSSQGSSIVDDEWTVAQTNINGAVVSDTVDKGGPTVPVYISGRSVKACTSLSLNTSGSAAKLSAADAGSSVKPIYFLNGVPVVCDGAKLDVSIDGNADTATYATSAGSATSAGKLSAADKGSSTKPIYFSNGIPAECGSKLDVAISGKADTAGVADSAGLANKAKMLVKSDGTTAYNAGDASTPVYFTTSGVPSACTSLDLNTSGSAAKLSAADKGSSTKPIYFSNGIPAECGSKLDVAISGKADTAGVADSAGLANKAKMLVKSDGSTAYNAGDANTPVYFTTSGVPSACTSLDLNTSGSAAKLSAPDKGSASKPVYFTGGVPAEITSLNLGSGTITTTGNVSFGNVSCGNVNATGYVYGAVWNDYAEFREGTAQVEPGRIVYEVGDDTVALTDRRMMAAVSAVSDTFGFAIGETDKAQLPLAVAGRVLVYTDVDRTEFKAGDVVCSGPNGTVSKMTREEIREYPECILGVVSAIPSYETWGTGNVKVNGRIWVTIK